METTITLISPPELTLAEDEEGHLSALVQVKLEETKTLTIVSTDEQFETAGEQLIILAQLRERIRGTLKPFIEFWHQGHSRRSPDAGQGSGGGPFMSLPRGESAISGLLGR